MSRSNTEATARSVTRRGTFAAEPTVYGHSVARAPLLVWGRRKPPLKLLIFAGIHGEEPDTTVLLSRALRSTERCSAGCAVVLCANPDGLQRGTRANARGVDLNRNFPSANWQPRPVLHQWIPDSEREVVLAPGPHPASEPEVTALAKLIDDLEPEQVVALHSPLGLIDDPNSTELGRCLAQRSGLPRTIIPNESTPGSFGSWANDRGLPAITYELPNATLWEMLPVHLPILQELIEHATLAI